jgi:hypothetical protein
MIRLLIFLSIFLLTLGSEVLLIYFFFPMFSPYIASTTSMIYAMGIALFWAIETKK